MTPLDEHPINRYHGMNPDFVHEVWRKRRVEEAAKAPPATQEERRIAEKVSKQLALLKNEPPIVVRPSGQSIIESVCDRRGVTLRAIRGSRGSKAVAAARSEAMIEVRRVRPDLAICAIGRMFNRNHSTIHYALKGGRWREAA